MNESKHRQLMAILNQKKFDKDARHDLIFSYTNGRTFSSRELYDTELTDLVNQLQRGAQQTTEMAHRIALKEKRSVVLSIAQRTGIHEGTNFDKFNSFMENRSILKKRLNKYTLDELDELIKQFRGLEANYLKSADKAGTKAWNQANGFNPILEN